MMILPTAVLALVAILAQGPVAVTAADDLAAVRDLYASASFEEALTRLANPESRLTTVQTEQYRALCLLGLGRTADAEASLERMVTARPLYEIPENEVSPRLVALFHEVRKRVLPVTARDLYVSAKAAFDARDFAKASAEFHDMLSVMDDETMVDQAEGLRDLRLLGEGFLKLADGEVAAAARAAEAAEAARVAAAKAAAEPKIPERTVFSAADADVVAPVELERPMPPWNPPTAMARTTEYRGVLEVLINERGLIESGTMRRASSPVYDQELLKTLTSWKFKPALRNGEPVKFLKTFDIVLLPRR
jgi:hypothetical protein